MAFCVAVAGGFVGRIAWSDGMEAFAAIVPALEESGTRLVRPFADRDADGWPGTREAARLRALLTAVSAIAGNGEMLEASASAGGASVDLVRGTSRLQWPAGTRRRVHEPLPGGDVEATLVARIKSPVPDGGFLLSASDRGELLAVVPGDGRMAAAKLRIDEGRATLEAEGLPSYAGAAGTAAAEAFRGSEAAVLLGIFPAASADPSRSGGGA